MTFKSTHLWPVFPFYTPWKHPKIFTRNLVKHTNCLSVFDHFVGLALKGLMHLISFEFYQELIKSRLDNKIILKSVI